jgi:hypothetical protein
MFDISDCCLENAPMLGKLSPIISSFLHACLDRNRQSINTLSNVAQLFGGDQSTLITQTRYVEQTQTGVVCSTKEVRRAACTACWLL